ncbi:MAG TPA: STAS domain-containing protein [Gemmatimonadales bacterium]
MPTTGNVLTEILESQESSLLTDWLRDQHAGTARRGLISDRELEGQSREFLGLLRTAMMRGNNSMEVHQAAEWAPVRELLGAISRSRGQQGFSPSETATFVFSLKPSLFARIRERLGADPDRLFVTLRDTSELLDRLGLYTTEVYQQGREDVIMRQQQDMLELSTPVVKLWDGVLALPLIGTLDSARTQTVMESLLERIVETGAEVAIVDITGVPTVDTLVAQHLMKTVTAARLMGADCIISGIRPQIAQTIVHLGVALGDVTTKASLADAFALALQRRGLRVAPAAAARA